MPSFSYKEAEEVHNLDFLDSELVQMDRCDFVSMSRCSVKRTDEGFLQGEAPVAKVGIMSYMNSDGTVFKQFVPEETLFDSESMATLKMKPVTNMHPSEVLLDKETVRRRMVGSTGSEVKRDGDFLITSLAIHDSEAILHVDSGRQELSPGYRSWILNKPGVFRGENYDSIQVKRVYNHVALCDRARGGRDLRLNLDSVEVSQLDGFENIQKKEKPMPKMTIRGIDYECPAEVIQYSLDQAKQLDSVTSELAKSKEGAEKAQANLDSVQDELKTAKAVDVQKLVREGVAKRIALVTTAQNVLDAAVFAKVDSMSDAEVKKAVIMTKSPTAVLDGKSEVYIDARFDTIVESLSTDATADNRSQSADSPLPKTDAVEKAKSDSEKAILDSYMNLDKWGN